MDKAFIKAELNKMTDSQLQAYFRILERGRGMLMTDDGRARDRLHHEIVTELAHERHVTLTRLTWHDDKHVQYTA